MYSSTYVESDTTKVQNEWKKIFWAFQVGRIIEDTSDYSEEYLDSTPEFETDSFETSGKTVNYQFGTTRRGP